MKLYNKLYNKLCNNLIFPVQVYIRALNRFKGGVDVIIEFFNLLLLWFRSKLIPITKRDLVIRVRLKSGLLSDKKKDIYFVKQKGSWLYKGKIICKNEMKNILLDNIKVFSLRVRIALFSKKLFCIILELTKDNKRFKNDRDICDVFLDYFKTARLMKDCELLGVLEGFNEFWYLENYWQGLKAKASSVIFVRWYYMVMDPDVQTDDRLKRGDLYFLGLGFFHFFKLKCLNNLYGLYRLGYDSVNEQVIKELYCTLENIYRRIFILVKVLNKNIITSVNNLILRKFFNSYSNVISVSNKVSYVIVRGINVEFIENTNGESNFNGWDCYMEGGMEYIYFENDRKRYTLERSALLNFSTTIITSEGTENLAYDIGAMCRHIATLAEREKAMIINKEEYELNNIVDALYESIIEERAGNFTKEVIELTRFGNTTGTISIDARVINLYGWSNICESRTFEYDNNLKLKKAIVNYWGLNFLVYDWKKEIKLLKYRNILEESIKRMPSRIFRFHARRKYIEWCKLNGVDKKRISLEEVYCTTVIFRGKRGLLYWRVNDWSYIFKSGEVNFVIKDITELQEDYFADGIIRSHEHKLFKILCDLILGSNNYRVGVYWMVKIFYSRCFGYIYIYNVFRVLLRFLIESMYKMLGFIIIFLDYLSIVLGNILNYKVLKIVSLVDNMIISARRRTVVENIWYIFYMYRYFYDKYILRLFYMLEASMVALKYLWTKYIVILGYMFKGKEVDNLRYKVFYNEKTRLLGAMKDLPIGSITEVQSRLYNDWYNELDRLLENEKVVEDEMRAFSEEDVLLNKENTLYTRLGVTRAHDNIYSMKLIYLLRTKGRLRKTRRKLVKFPRRGRS